ncbi:MAG TPA: MASE1 domain-containing protein, partial [Sphingomonas sp.]
MTDRAGAKRAATIGIAYLAAAVAAVASTRFGGGVAMLWVAGAVLISGLTVSPPNDRSAILVACGIASFVATATVGVGLVAAAPLALVNVAEAVIAAWLVDRFKLTQGPLDSVDRLMRLVLAVGVAAPALTAPVGAAIVHWATGTGFRTNLIGWSIGHGLGAVTAVPVFTFFASGAFRRWAATASGARLVEAGALFALVSGTTILVFSQTTMPLLFLPILPVILATFRIGRIGAAASVIIIAGVGGWLTARGLG